MTTSEFATSVRTKYPGAYDNVNDQDLVSKVVGKYPQYQSQISDFGKTSTPAQQPSFLDSAKLGAKALYASGMLPQQMGASDLGENLTGAMGQIKTGALDIPKALLDPMSIPQKVVDAGTNLEQGVEQTSIGDAGKYLLSHPLTTASLFSGLGQEAGPESSVRSFADQMAGDSKLASFNKKMAMIPENATKMEGFNQPIPTQDEINTAAQNVIKAHQDVVSQHGKVLNAAKGEAGLPVTLDDVKASSRRFGNDFNLNVNEPLALPEDKMALEPGAKVQVSGPNLPDQELTYRGPMATDSVEALRNLGLDENLIQKMQQPFYDLSMDVPGHPAKSSLSRDGLTELGYKVPDVEKPMPYKIGEHDDPRSLETEINRFKANGDYINTQDKIKAASYFQDQIQNTKGVFTPTGKSDSPQLGRLKGLYGDLADVIRDESPTLAGAKSKFSDMMNSLDKVSKNLDPDRPGAAQAYLKRLFTSNSAQAQDDLTQLAYLEKMSGKPVVTQLFQKFAGKAFEPLVSRPGREMLEAAGGLTSAALGHPAGLIPAAGLLAAQSPRVLGMAESLAGPTANMASRFGPAAALQASRVGLQRPFNTPDMHRLKAQLSNATHFKDTKYAAR